MQAKQDQQTPSYPRLQHVSLPIQDGKQNAIRAFYSDLLGLQEKPVPNSLEGRGILWFAVGKNEMELHFIPDTYLAHPREARHFCLEVADIDDYRQRLIRAGYEIRDAEIIPNRPRFFCTDPCGNHIELTSIQGPYNEDSAQFS